MKKYKLINLKTKEEHLCDKVTIDGFDYYVGDGEIKLNDPITDKYRVWFWRDDCSLLGRKKIIATNNPHIDIPKVVDEVEELAISYEKSFTDNGVTIKADFKAGYNKSQETHPFSEEDMIEFLNYYQKTCLLAFNSSGQNHGKTTKELFQLWKEQQPITLYYES
jgi:hypothetical protein